VLTLVDAGGARIARLVELGRDRELLRHTDVTAGVAACVTWGCQSAEIRTIALPVSATVARHAPACPLRLVGRRTTVQGDRLRLGISCAGFAIRCSARMTVRAGRRIIARGFARYNRTTPPFAAADLRIRAAGLRMLRRNGRTRVQISARIGAPGPAADPSAPGTVVRRTARTLVVAR
jgi:hypothetical protein